MDRAIVAAHVAKRLALRRTELQLSLAQVASRSGVSLQQIHRYEIGDNALSVGMLWLLSKSLDTSVMYFFEGLD